MATTIKLKNGSGAPAASDLVQGEPAIDLTNKRLYTENASGVVIEVGSNPSSLSIDGTAVTATATEINTLDGITSTTAELNILDGVTSTAAELNILDGVTASTAEINLLDGVTATTAELNILDGVTSTAAELNILDGVTASTAELNILDGVTATAAELNVLDGVTAFVDEDDMASNSATAIPSQQSVKAYVDSTVAAEVTAQDLDFQGDTGGALSIDLDSETLTIAGGTGVDTSGSGNTLTVAIDSTVATLTGTQTLTNKTLTTPVISSISNTGTLTLPTSTDTLVGRDTTDTLTNKTLTSAVLNTGVSGTAILDEDDMLSDSATQLATQQSIKAYVDSQVATADALPEVLANGNTTGGTDISVSSGDDITFADNSKVIFGDGSDLQIYHGGTNSIIKDAGTGDLRILGSTNVDLRNAVDSVVMLRATAGGSVQARYNGDIKLETTASGIDVTGNVAVSSAGTRRIDISNTSLTDAGEMASLQWDDNADLTFQGRASDGTFKANWYRIEASASDGLADAHRFYTDSSVERLSITSSGIDVTGTIGSGTWQGSVISDTYIANDLTISGGTIENTPIGAATPSTAEFTSVDVSGIAQVTGQIRSGTHIIAGQSDLVASPASNGGEVAMTINDGGGNANLTFNHTDRVPDQDGNAFRITCNTDSSSNAAMLFEIAQNVTEDVQVDTTEVLRLDTAGAEVTGTLEVDNDLKVDTDTLFVDVSADRVGVNKTPATTFDVAGTASYTGTTPGNTNFTAVVTSNTASLGIGSHSGIPSIQGFGTGTGYDIALCPNNGGVGIGTATVGATLTVQKDIASTVLATMENGDVTQSHVLKLTAGGAGTGTKIFECVGGAGDVVEIRGNGDITTDGNLTDVGTVTSRGSFRGTTTTGGGTPTFSFDGDTNTGMYHVSADKIGLTCGGTTVMNMTGSRVAIGLGGTTAGAHLEVKATETNEQTMIVNGTGTQSSSRRGIRFEVDNTAYGYITVPTGGGLGFGTGTGTERFRINPSTGYIGINEDGAADEQLVIRAGNYSGSQDGGLAVNLGDITGNHWKSAFKVKSNSGGSPRTAIDATDGGVTGTTIEALAIDGGGNVMIGKTVITAATAGVSILGSSSTAGTSSLNVSTKNSGTGTSNHLVNFRVGGSVGASGTASGAIAANGSSQAAFVAYSDERLKENIVSLPSQLEKIKSLRPVEFDYKDGSGHQIGFIAQEMREVYSDCVGEDEEGILTIGGWNKTEARLVKAIQEQQAMIEALQAEVAKLKGE